MKYKGERVHDYRIEFKTNDDSDYGFEMVEAHNTDEAIEIFRSYYPKETYTITCVYRKISGSWDANGR